MHSLQETMFWESSGCASKIKTTRQKILVWSKSIAGHFEKKMKYEIKARQRKKRQLKKKWPL